MRRSCLEWRASNSARRKLHWDAFQLKAIESLLFFGGKRRSFFLCGLKNVKERLHGWKWFFNGVWISILYFWSDLEWFWKDFWDAFHVFLLSSAPGDVSPPRVPESSRVHDEPGQVARVRSPIEVRQPGSCHLSKGVFLWCLKLFLLVFHGISSVYLDSKQPGFPAIPSPGRPWIPAWLCLRSPGGIPQKSRQELLGKAKAFTESHPRWLVPKFPKR